MWGRWRETRSMSFGMVSPVWTIPERTMQPSMMQIQM